MNTLSTFDIPGVTGPEGDAKPIVTPIRPEDIAAVLEMTFPTFRPHLDRCLKGEVDDWLTTNALVARDGTAPVGLVLVQPHLAFEAPGGDVEQNKVASLLSIYVNPSWRRRGVASLLVHAMEEELGRHGCASLMVRYTTQMPAWKAFERVLAACRWSPPEATLLMAKAHVSEVATFPWLSAVSKAPPGFELFEWTQLRPDERTRLQDDVAGGIIPGELSPFADEADIEPTISVGVRHDGEVVAWMIVTRSPLAPKALCYRSHFVHPRLRTRHSLGPVVLAAALQRHVASPIAKDRPEGVYGMSLKQSTKMINFYRKRLLPYCFSSYESRESSKRIG